MTIDEKIKDQRHKVKRERFVKIATNRTNTILTSLRLLGNCANRSNYEYTDEDVRQMFEAIDEAVKSAKQKFTAEEQKKEPFRFTKRD